LKFKFEVGHQLVIYVLFSFIVGDSKYILILKLIKY